MLITFIYCYKIIDSELAQFLREQCILTYMQSQLYYCLNPCCPQSNARVFLEADSQHHRSSCTRWVVPEDLIHQTQCTQYAFDPEWCLKFASRPIEAQEYISQNQEALTNHLVSFSKMLRSEVLNQLDQFDQHIRKSLRKLFSYSEKYRKIKDLSSQQGIKAQIKSIKLQEIMSQPFPNYQDIRLPQTKNITELIQKFKQNLKKCWSLLEQTTDNRTKKAMKEESVDEESIESTKSLIQMQLVPSAKNVKKDMKDVWEEASKNCNLKTAQMLMGQSMHKFYSYCEETKTAKVTCCYCEFTIEATTPKKAIGTSNCAFSILQHICSNHPIAVRQNFDLRKNRVTCVPLRHILDQMHNPQISSVGLLDSYSLGRAKCLQMVDTDVTFELCYNQFKPLYCNTFIKGGQPRQSMSLLGYLSCYIGVFLQKKLVIYTSNHKREALTAFLEYYSIPHVTVVSSPEPKSGELSVSISRASTSSKKSPFL